MDLYFIGIGIGMGILFVILISILTLLIINKVKQSKIRKIGSEFEKRMSKKIEAWSSDKNKFYHGPSLYKYKNDKLFEIDGILVTAYAIIVFEYKSTIGAISGHAKDATWTKTIVGKKYDFPSPIIQNDKHIEHIINILNIKVPILSFIVFDKKVNSVDIDSKPEHVIITTDDKLTNVLDQIDNLLNVKINQYEIQAINNTLLNHATKKSRDKKQHEIYTRQKKI
ncbi:nuclease-like protein [Mycoplasma testudineum]|uniref:Nuclease-like protein n=1 Tax=Mycoplasma testudineum TaxID=244584 RepID=A0A4R6IGF0_9MOLU|nr:nuclease-related domain-containing protein [Mycoplasma testudineum]OYD27105.1 hypothetical protein CG473_00470 [Mycoplasma testudineum]TDO21144.1 nuclease-like protein [Mycoplasma testudineum]